MVGRISEEKPGLVLCLCITGAVGAKERLGVLAAPADHQLSPHIAAHASVGDMDVLAFEPLNLELCSLLPCELA